MQSANQPDKISIPFANTGAKRPIPNESQIGITAGAASFTDGFPPVTFIAIEDGGTPPAGLDFNGIFNRITTFQQWQSAGGLFKFDSAFATEIGGYPKGALVLANDLVSVFQNAAENNAVDPNINPASWKLVDIGLQTKLIAVNGADLVTVTQTGAGATSQTVSAALQAIRTMEGYGGAESATAPANTAAANALVVVAGSKEREIDLNGRTYTLSAAPTNTYGLRFDNGALLSPSRVPGFNTQYNTYADMANGLVIGRENFAAFWKACTANTQCIAPMYGDSTVETSGVYPVKPNELVQRAFFSAGVNNVKTLNHGVSGTSWSDLDTGLIATELVAATPAKLIFIKYGINDAVKANPVATLMADARAKLTTIRALPNGAVGNVSIVLMGPNSTYSPSTGQDYAWYEKIRNCYIQLAREFECVFFDTYAYLQNTRYAFAVWQDSIPPYSESIHPDPVAVYWIWLEGVKRFLLGDGTWNIQKSNHFFNINNYTRPAVPTTTPASYDYGTTVESALTTNGYPINGVLVTTRHVDGTTVQTLSTQDVHPLTITRRGGTSTWTLWDGLPYIMVAGDFTNLWAAKGTGAGFDLPGWQLSNKVLRFFGTITGGAVTGGPTSSFTTLPSNLRPTGVQSSVVSGADAANTLATIRAGTDGQCQVFAAANTTISLNGFCIYLQ